MTVRLLVPAYGKQTNALYTGTQAAERALIDAGQADNNLAASFDYPAYLDGKSMAPAVAFTQPSVDAPSNGVPRVAFAGDSFAEFARNLTTISTYNTPFSFVNWLRWRFGDRMYTDTSLNFAEGGTRTEHLLNVQLPKLLASGAKIVIINDGTNDTGQVGGAALSVANVKAFLAQTSAAGINIIWNCVIPQNSFNNTLFQQNAEFNRQLFLLSMVRANRLSVVDHYPSMVDYGTSKCLTGLLVADGVHPTTIGAKGMADNIALHLDRLLPLGGLSIYNPNDLYDAALCPSGSLIPGGLFSGTGGSLSNGATGTAPGTGLATNWSGGFANTAASTATANFFKATDATFTNLPVQKLTIGGTADTNFFRMEAAGVLSAGMAAGDTLYATGLVSWTGLVNVKAVVLRLSCVQAAQTYDYQDGSPGTISGNSVGPLPATAAKLALRTPSLLLQAGFAAPRLRVEIYPDVAGQPVGGELSFQQFALRKVLV